MKWKIAVTYLCIFVLVGLMMALLPTHEWMVWEPAVVIPVCALLFTLLVYLSAQLAGTGGSVAKVACTALFILFFLPGAENAFARDEEAMLELSSQCIVPFFIGQYERIHTRDFRWGYLLMLLMGIFCSYTHDGITLPLCGSFLWLAFLNRDTFFKTACWPMVIGFLIGTGFSIWHHLHTGQSDMPDGLGNSRIHLLLELKTFDDVLCSGQQHTIRGKDSCILLACHILYAPLERCCFYNLAYHFFLLLVSCLYVLITLVISLSRLSSGEYK